MSETPETSERWVTISEACYELHLQYRKVKRLIDEGRLQTRGDLLDRRAILIDVNKLKELIRR